MFCFMVEFIFSHFVVNKSAKWAVVAGVHGTVIGFCAINLVRNKRLLLLFLHSPLFLDGAILII